MSIRVLADPIGADQARRAAEQELRKAEYHRDDPGLVARILAWIGKHLDPLLTRTPGGSATLVLLVLLAAVIIFAVVHAANSRSAARAQSTTDADLLRPGARIDHRRAAETAERAGNLADAVREWLRAAVAEVERRGILDPRPGRTGDEFAREAGALLPTAADVLARAVSSFDLIWFGGGEASPSDVALAREAADAVRHARIQRRSAPTVGYSVPR